MGKLTRRVKFIARERRLSIPAEFLHRHHIQRGDPMWVSIHDKELYVFDAQGWQDKKELAASMSRWFPDEKHAYFGMFEFGIQVRLGSQDRIVLPKTFPFQPQETVRLHWELLDGMLRMTPEQALPAPLAAVARPAAQTSLADYLGTSGGEHFDRKRATHEFTERISMERIDLQDQTCSTQPPIPGEALLRSLRVEGIRRAVVLWRREDGKFQIIHGFRRVAAARQLKMASVPALVFRGLSIEDRDRLKIMEYDDAPVLESTPLRRLQSTVKLYQGQVDFNEIEKITGRRKRTLQRYLRVAGNQVLRDAIESGRLSIFKAEEILKAGVDPEIAIRRKMTVKEIRAHGRRNASGGSRPRRRIHRRGSIG